MPRILRRLLGAAWIACAPLAAASPCVPGSLQDYINLASGCEIGSTNFSGFYIAPGQAFATAIDPSLIAVTPNGSASDPALMFAVNVAASAGELFEAFFHYQMTAGLGALLTSASIALDGASATGDGVVIVAQDLCLGGAFDPLFPIGCSGIPEALIAFAIEGDSLNPVNTLFAGVAFIDIFSDIVIDGGLSGTATLGGSTSGFATDGAAAVPTPSTLPLTLLGLALVVTFTRRRASRSTRS